MEKSSKKKGSASFAVKPEQETTSLALPEGTGYSSLYGEHYGMPMHGMDHGQQALHLHHDYYAAEAHGAYNPYDHMQGYFHPPPTYPPYRQHEESHEQSHHSHQQPEEEKEQDLYCPHDDCGKMFRKQSAYHQHLKTHTNTPKPFLCRICSFSFSRSHDLKRHEYIHSKDKPFICDNCNRGFSRRDALKRHLDSMKNRPGGCSASGSSKKSRRDD